MPILFLNYKCKNKCYNYTLTVTLRVNRPNEMKKYLTTLDWRVILGGELALIFIIKVALLLLIGHFCFAHPLKDHLTPLLMSKHLLT